MGVQHIRARGWEWERLESLRGGRESPTMPQVTPSF